MNHPDLFGRHEIGPESPALYIRVIYADPHYHIQKVTEPHGQHTAKDHPDLLRWMERHEYQSHEDIPSIRTDGNQRTCDRCGVRGTASHPPSRAPPHLHRPGLW